MNIEREINWLLEEKYQGHLTKKAQKDIAKLKKGFPLDYLIGQREFLGAVIDLHNHPLIPRTETEFWTEKLIQKLKKHPHKKMSALDIFAGSGCIGIALLKNIPWVKVDFAEQNKKFIQQIETSLRLNHIPKQRYNLILSNVFQKINHQYDLIIANPPYLSHKRKNLIQKEVLKFEPSSALFAKENGFFFIQQFIQQVKNYLYDQGVFYMEFDSCQKKAIEQLLKKSGLNNYHFQKDQYRRWRWVEVIYSKNTP